MECYYRSDKSCWHYTKMLSNSPIYDAALIGLCISSVVLNCYALYLIIYITPQAMKDFRHCLCMLSIFDALFALFIGIVLIVSFTPPALAGVIRGPVIMFFYRNFGYNCCKGLVCVAFVSVCAILYFQNVAMRIRYLTINPNKKCYEWYNSKIGFTFVYTSGFVVSSVVGGSIYLHIFDEKDIPSMLATYPNSKTVFFDFIPGENILMAADPASPMCFFIIGFVSLCVLYVEINSYAMFFMARRLLRKHAANFSKQMFDLQQQFLYLVMIQVSIPLLFVVVPLLLFVYQTTLNLGMTKLQMEIGTVWMAIYSNLNVSATILCISPFRRFTKRITIDVVLKVLKIKTQVIPVMEVQATESLDFQSRVF